MSKVVDGRSEIYRAARTNWSGNYSYRATGLDFPTSVEQVQRLVAVCAKAKALGARHSFNSIADSTGQQISLQHLDEIELDAEAQTVTVGAGVTYGQLAPSIDRRGFAVHNLASLPHISVVGACATATHGSGCANGNLSTAVRELEMVKAHGEVVKLSRETVGNRFDGMVVGLGALGIITRIKLAVQPRFDMRQAVYENLSFSELGQHLEEIFASGYSVSVFTDWQHHRATQVWIKQRVSPDSSSPNQPDFFGATAATQKLHPLAGHSAEHCTDQMGIPGAWYERMPHFKTEFTPSSGAELQTEYFVPREHGYAAIMAVEQLRDRITPLLFVSEFRTIAADDLWMSPCYQRPSLALHFTWKPDWPAVQKLLPRVEAQLAPFHPRPHWAKLFTMPATQIISSYPKSADFKTLVTECDPEGKFRNAFLETNLPGR